MADMANGVPLSGMVLVSVRQDMCTGDGLCEEIAPAVFTLLDDGLAYVHEGGKVSKGGAAQIVINPNLEQEVDAIIASALPCPGDCIFVEKDGVSLVDGRSTVGISLEMRPEIVF